MVTLEEKIKSFDRNNISALSKEFDEEFKIYFSDFIKGLFFLRIWMKSDIKEQIKGSIFENKMCKEYFKKNEKRISYLLLEKIPEDKWSDSVLSDEELKNYMLLTRTLKR